MIKNNSQILIKTPNGWESFEGIKLTHHQKSLKIHLENGCIFHCSENHPLKSHGRFVLAKDLKEVDDVDTLNGPKTIFLIENIETPAEFYDVCNTETHEYYTNDIISHNCDCDFTTSGHTVVDGPILKWYEENQVQDPLEKRGLDGNLWIWEYPDPMKSYIITADVARGDGLDYSAFHVLDPETFTQVAEYKGQIGTKDFANLLSSVGHEYNQAMLIVENANVGWTVLEFLQVFNYPNLFYSIKEGTLVDVQTALLKGYDLIDRTRLVPGFSTTRTTRPVIISKLDTYFKDKIPIIKSKRTINELFTFIWKNSRPEAQQGYNDDLVISLSIGFWIRDTALLLKERGQELTRKTLELTVQDKPIYTRKETINNPWKMKMGNEDIDLTWLVT